MTLTSAGGRVTTNFSGSSTDDAYAVALQTDGKIVLAGTSNRVGNYDFALARYKPALALVVRPPARGVDA